LVLVRLIRRAGYSGWWVLMAIVPIGNLIGGLSGYGPGQIRRRAPGPQG
jgi:membrane protein YqaA with SNARE-associated domain